MMRAILLVTFLVLTAFAAAGSVGAAERLASAGDAGQDECCAQVLAAQSPQTGHDAILRRMCAKGGSGVVVPCPAPHAVEPGNGLVRLRSLPEPTVRTGEAGLRFPPFDDHFRPPRRHDLT